MTAPDNPATAPLLPIERPNCPVCDTRMMLARLNPGPRVRSELRTFECSRCNHVMQTLVEDPITSGSSGWINSGLNPPR